MGAGKKNCTDPKILRRQIATRPIDLGIQMFDVYNFDYAKRRIYSNDSSLRWTPIYNTQLNDCLTLSMPENLIKVGIFVISIFIHDPPFPKLDVFVHQKGLLFANIPDAWEQIEASGEGFVVPIVHEVEELLNYDEEKCEDSKNYIFDQCWRSLVQNVSILIEVAKGLKLIYFCLFLLLLSILFLQNSRSRLIYLTLVGNKFFRDHN